MDIKQEIARGLSSEICGTNPIVDGDEWFALETSPHGADIEVRFEDEGGKTRGAILRVIETWED